MNNKFINEIRNISENIIEINVNLKNLNTMKLDGIVKYLIRPSSFIELKKVLNIINKYNIKYYVIGNGSNIIFTNKEKECLIKLNFIKRNKNILLANEFIPKVAYNFYKDGYEGLQYIAMIPASVGGAIVMNAGAYNHSISDIIEYVYCLDENLNFKVLSKEECEFSYRNSIFKNSKKIVLGCKVKLINKDKNEIKKIMDECNEKRKNSQPIEFPNSGSIFKNKQNIKAWELINSVNLKGYKRNGAMVSDKHCNFIINYNNAKYEDIIYIINLIEEKVRNKFDIALEKEIIIID